MRDKKDATIFIRKIDRSHPSNIRVVIPPTIDKFLKSPVKVVFSIKNDKVVVEKENL